MKISRNRANGKRYEGELVKAIRNSGIYARLGRSNEEVDIILPDCNILIECKSTSKKNFTLAHDRGTKDQFFRIRELPGIKFYAVRYKGDGLKGWRFYPIPGSIQVLPRDEGLTLDEFVILVQKIIQRKEAMPA